MSSLEMTANQTPEDLFLQRARASSLIGEIASLAASGARRPAETPVLPASVPDSEVRRLLDSSAAATIFPIVAGAEARALLDAMDVSTPWIRDWLAARASEDGERLVPAEVRRRRQALAVLLDVPAPDGDDEAAWDADETPIGDGFGLSCLGHVSPASLRAWRVRLLEDGLTWREAADQIIVTLALRLGDHDVAGTNGFETFSPVFTGKPRGQSHFQQALGLPTSAASSMGAEHHYVFGGAPDWTTRPEPPF